MKRGQNADLVITNNLKEAFKEAKKYHKDNKILAMAKSKHQASMAGF
jgi:hypothetical protein